MIPSIIQEEEKMLTTFMVNPTTGTTKTTRTKISRTTKMVKTTTRNFKRRNQLKKLLVSSVDKRVTMLTSAQMESLTILTRRSLLKVHTFS